MSKQQSTQAKMDAQGGVLRAVSADVAEAAVKGREQQVGTQAKISELLQSKAGGGKSADAADILSKGIVDGTMKGAENLKSALAGAGALMAAQVGGKTGSDIKKVEEANEKYKDKGGFVGFSKDSARVQTQKDLGNTSGQMDIPEESRVKTLENIMDKATLNGRGKETKKDLMRAGLMNEDNSFNPQNWVQGIAHLGANNMQGQNAIVAGGATYSGAVGDDSTIQMNALNSTSTGSKTESIQNTKSMAKMFNLGEDNENKLALKPNGDIDYDNSSKKAIGEFGQYVDSVGLAKETKNGILENVVAKTSKATGASEEAVWAGMALTGGYIVQKGLGDPVGKTVSAIRGKTNKVSKSEKQPKNYGTSNQDGDSNKNTSQHKDSFKDIKQYTENFGNSKAELAKEGKNLSSLEKQKDFLSSQNKDTTAIDSKIDDSKTKMATHTKDMDVANRNITATKYLAGGGSAVKPKMSTTGKAGAVIGLVVAAYEVYDSLMGDSENSQAPQTQQDKDVSSRADSRQSVMSNAWKWMTTSHGPQGGGGNIAGGSGFEGSSTPNPNNNGRNMLSQAGDVFNAATTIASGTVGALLTPTSLSASADLPSAGVNNGTAIQSDFNPGNITMLSPSAPAPFAQTSGGGGGSSPIAMPTIDTSSISTSLANVLSTFSSASMVSTATQGMAPQSGDMMNTGKNI